MTYWIGTNIYIITQPLPSTKKRTALSKHHNQVAIFYFILFKKNKKFGTK